MFKTVNEVVCVQIRRFHAAVEQEILYLILEARGVGCVWRRLQARHFKEIAAAYAGTSNRSSSEALSFKYLFNLSGAAILELCKGENSLAQKVQSVITQIGKMSTEERFKAIGMDSVTVQEQVCHNAILKGVPA